mgnify:CR=1 FL=1
MKTASAELLEISEGVGLDDRLTVEGLSELIHSARDEGMVAGDPELVIAAVPRIGTADELDLVPPRLPVAA